MSVSQQSRKERAADELGDCEETGRKHIADDLNPNWLDDENDYHCFWCGQEVEVDE